MKVLILGCGRTGALLAGRLSAAGQEVTIVDQDSSAFQRLESDFQGRTVLGNGTEQDALRRAGIENADVFVALTQGDNRNIMASQVARVIFNVPQVYTRVKDPMRAEIFTQLGLRTFCTTVIGADYVAGLIPGKNPASQQPEGIRPTPVNTMQPGSRPRP